MTNEQRKDLKARAKFWLILLAFGLVFYLCVCVQRYSDATYDYNEARRVMQSESMRYSTLLSNGIAAEADRRRLVDARAVYLRAEKKWEVETEFFWQKQK